MTIIAQTFRIKVINDARQGAAHMLVVDEFGYDDKPIQTDIVFKSNSLWAIKPEFHRRVQELRNKFRMTSCSTDTLVATFVPYEDFKEYFIPEKVNG